VGFQDGIRKIQVLVIFEIQKSEEGIMMVTSCFFQYIEEIIFQNRIPFHLLSQSLRD